MNHYFWNDDIKAYICVVLRLIMQSYRIQSKIQNFCRRFSIKNVMQILIRLVLSILEHYKILYFFMDFWLKHCTSRTIKSSIIQIYRKKSAPSNII